MKGEGPRWSENIQYPERISKIKVGDVLYVRETFRINRQSRKGEVEFKADNTFENNLSAKWKPSLHMPRELSRIHLEVMRVRVERACDISEEDAIAEGCHRISMIGLRHGLAPRAHFQSLWTDLYGPDAWEKWVWVYDLKRIK